VTDSPEGWMFRGAMFNGRDLSEHPIDIRDDLAGIVIEFTDRWTGIRGSVMSPPGRTAVDTLIVVFPTDTTRWSTPAPTARRLRSVRPRENGEFALSSVPTGDYYIVAIPDDRGGDWQDPAFLDVLSRDATRITINDGDQRVVDLRRKDIRP
jgi:hypothetical protein